MSRSRQRCAGFADACGLSDEFAHQSGRARAMQNVHDPLGLAFRDAVPLGM